MVSAGCGWLGLVGVSSKLTRQNLTKNMFLHQHCYVDSSQFDCYSTGSADLSD